MILCNEDLTLAYNDRVEQPFCFWRRLLLSQGTRVTTSYFGQRLQQYVSVVFADAVVVGTTIAGAVVVLIKKRKQGW